MTYKDYKFADIKDDSEVKQRLAQVEQELSAQIGNEVILIAYQRDEKLNS